MKFAPVLALVLVAACGPLNSRDAGMNAKADAHGGAVRLDTEANRRELTVGYDLDIDSEKHGEKPQAADASWEDHWLSILKGLQRRGPNGAFVIENHERYIEYIVKGRRAASLPDLPDYARK